MNIFSRIAELQRDDDWRTGSSACTMLASSVAAAGSRPEDPNSPTRFIDDEEPAAAPLVAPAPAASAPGSARPSPAGDAGVWALAAEDGGSTGDREEFGDMEKEDLAKED